MLWGPLATTTTRFWLGPSAPRDPHLTGRENHQPLWLEEEVEQGLESRILSPLWSLLDLQTHSLQGAGWCQCLESYPWLGTLSVALPVFTTVLRREHYCPVSQTRKLRPREEMGLAQGYAARRSRPLAPGWGLFPDPAPPFWEAPAFSLLQPPHARSCGWAQRKGWPNPLPSLGTRVTLGKLAGSAPLET